MQPKNPNEKLNFVLDYIKQQREYNDLYREIDEHANIRGQFYPGEIDLIMDKLRADGYVDFIAGNHLGTTQRASDGLQMRRSFEGTVFISKGGYVKEAELNATVERIRNNRERMLSVGTVLLAIGTFLLVAWEMYKTYCIEPHRLPH